MRRKSLNFHVVFLPVLVITGVLQGCDSNDTSYAIADFKDEWQVVTYDPNAFQPIPSTAGLNPYKVSLGEKLFLDPRLSSDNQIACSNCHQLSLNGAMNVPLAVGVGGAIGVVNVPSVFNSRFNFSQFWDGRANTLEDQVSGPVHNPIEMDSDWQQVISKLNQDADYQRQFKAIYSTGITSDNIQDAIAEFDRALVTPNAPFDRFLKGDQTALNEQQKKGYQLFQDYGCSSCHQGVNIGGNLFQKFGTVGNYFDGKNISKQDLGRFNVTGEITDLHVFKVPSLRNVAITGPYLHDGSIASLEQMISIMATYQLGRDLSLQEVQAIKAFLTSLTGEWKGKPLS